MSPQQLEFVAVGPFKTGTSWIYNYLSNYHQVALPTKVKETFFFDRKFNKGLDWYYSHFTKVQAGQKLGEVAPSYFSSPEACQRIHQLYPNCKIIVTLREPIARLMSFYQHLQQRGEIAPTCSFSEAVEKIEVLADTGKYYTHLSRWINTFGADNVKIIFFEELAKSPTNFSRILCNEIDLELEETPMILEQKVNSSYAPSNHNLAKITYQGVNLLHNLGLHKLVDVGKQLGIQRLLRSNKSSKFQLNQAEFANALNLVKDDVTLLETDLDLNISEWKDTWQQKGIEVEELTYNP